MASRLIAQDDTDTDTANPAIRSRTLLGVEGISVHFGGLAALSGVTFDVLEGQVTGLIGPNGAGKTTMFNVISGLQQPTEGSLYLDGERIEHLKPWNRAKRGVGRTFQSPKLMMGRTALDNVEVGLFARYPTRVLLDLVRPPFLDRDRAASRQRARDALDRVVPGLPSNAVVGKLSLAQRRGVEIGRALATGASLILLDEPFGGLHVDERAAMAEMIERLVSDGLTVLLIEHDMAMVGRLSTRIHVLNQGRMLTSGTPTEIAEDTDVIAAYLGTGESDA